MIYIEKIIVNKSSYPGATVIENFEFNCSSVNLFVGNQGCGKSTLLSMIQSCHKDLTVQLTEHTKKNGVNTFYFDTERDNPRVKDFSAYTNPNGTSKGIGIGGALSSRFKSHGEVLESMVINPLNEAKDCIVLLDEPESGLSITNQFKLIKAINKAVLNNCQLFIATHCYPLIQNFNVISLEHKQEMTGLEFIEKVK